jgi:pimeloyl-ACP methyl ester carboxylesterase
MSETAVEFENQGSKLQGMLHVPAGPGPHPIVVFLHGYTGSRIEDHCLFVKAGRDLCSNGISCLRFDFRGSGDSEGAFAEITAEGEISDAVRALEFARSLETADPRRVGMVGLGFGGAIAAGVVSKSAVKSLALWAPWAFIEYQVERGGKIVRDPYAWLPETYKAAIKKTGRVDMGGFVRGKPYFESLKHLDPLREIAKYTGPVLIVQGSEDQVILPANAEYLYDNVRGRRLLVMVDGADHTFSTAAWEAQVIETTRMWFAETL